MDSKNSKFKKIHHLKSNPLTGFALVFTAFLVIFTFVPLFIHSFSGVVVAQTCFTVILLSMVYILCHKKIYIFLGLALIAPFIVLDTLSLLNNSLYYMAYAYAFYTLFLIFAIYLLGKNILEKRKETTELVLGVITFFLLVGVLWSKFYFLQDFISPNSFKGIDALDFNNQNLAKGMENQFNLIYYSFSTLTSLGLGDIVPLHHFARSLTAIEAIFGQLFVATIIAKTVSIWRNNQNEDNI